MSRLAGGAGGLGLATCVVSATVSSGFPSTLITAERLIAEDFDGDGAQDLAALYLRRFDPARGQIIDQVIVFPSTGASQFRVAPNEVRYVTGNQFRIDHLPGRTRQHLARLRVDTSTASATRLRIDDTGVTATEPIATFPGGSNGAIVSVPFASGDFNRDGLSDVLEALPGEQRFDIACDRVVRWDAAHGTFPVQVYDLASFDFAHDGPSYVMALTSPDLVFYKLQ